MRALYLPELKQYLNSNNSVVTILDKEKYHHYINVLKLKKKEMILLLNGLGLKVTTEITNINKTNLELNILSQDDVEEKYHLDIAVGILKKDSFEKVIDFSTQLGIKNIIPLKTKFSAPYLLNEKRTSQIIISAIEQSNNPFLVKMTDEQAIETLDYSSYDQIYLFTNQLLNKMNDPIDHHRQHLFKKNLLIFGPEGGFSNEELTFFSQSTIKNLKIIHLDTPILRTPVAICASVGHVLRDQMSF